VRTGVEPAGKTEGGQGRKKVEERSKDARATHAETVDEEELARERPDDRTQGVPSIEPAQGPPEVALLPGEGVDEKG